jgi:hypothetical protein
MLAFAAQCIGYEETLDMQIFYMLTLFITQYKKITVVNITTSLFRNDSKRLEVNSLWWK